MHPARSSRRWLAMLASVTFALTLSAGTAFAAPCLDCEEPELPGDPGGNPTCGIVATTEPSITTATPRVGQTASGTRGVWAGNPTHFTYQWLAGGVVIPGATGLTSPALPESAHNKPLVFRVVATKSGCQSGVDHSAGKTVATGAALVVTTGPALSSASPRLGEPLSVSSGVWAPTATNFTYQWWSNGSPLAGANAATYTPSAVGMVGHSLSVVITAKRPGYADGSVTVSAPNAIGQGAAPVATTAPEISAAPKVGVPVSVSNGSWSPAVTSHSYQWQTNGVDIAGATSSSYTPTADTGGQTLRVVVRAHRAGHISGTAVSAARTVTAAEVPLAWSTAPSVVGKRVFGQVLRVNVGELSGAPTSVTVQWRRNGVAIPKATGSSHRLTRADIGRRITVTVTATKAGSATVTRVVNAGTVQKAPARWVGKRPGLVGKAKVGRTLKPGFTRARLVRAMSPDATTVTYRWFRAGKALARGTKPARKVVKADRGKVLTLRITLTRPGHKPVVLKASKRVR